MKIPEELRHAFAVLTDALDKHVDDALELRRLIHMSPRLSGDEDDTRLLLLEWMPWADALPVADTGALLVLPGSAGERVVFRAETDALPLDEDTGVEWSSRNPGVMHACGHDVHMAAAWLALQAVREVVPDGPSAAVLLQPREEVAPQGARDVVHSGLLRDSNTAAVIGVHVQSELPVGRVSAAAGMVNASWDDFAIVLRGRSGHAAYPHRSLDPIPAMASVISGLQQIVSRSADPMSPTVLTIGTITGGTGPNIIADSVRCAGTLRTSTEEDRQRVHGEVQRIVESYASAHGMQGTYDVESGGPPLRNDPGLAVGAAELLSGTDLLPCDIDFKSCGSDDFSFYTAEFPSLMGFVGTGAPTSSAGLHSPTFLPPDRSVRDCAVVFLAGYIAAAAGRVMGS